MLSGRNNPDVSFRNPVHELAGSNGCRVSLGETDHNFERLNSREGTFSLRFEFEGSFFMGKDPFDIFTIHSYDPPCDIKVTLQDGRELLFPEGQNTLWDDLRGFYIEVEG